MKTERELFQDFCEKNFDFERHEQTYFDEQTQCYENDIGECTESINMAWVVWKASANRQGYRLVPDEPTQEMIDKAVCDTPETPSQDYWHDSQPISDDQAIACYKAMIGEETK